MTLADRFWAKVTKVDGPGCWLWTGATTGEGWHGRIQGPDRILMAHRVSWELAYGPIPDGLQVLHSCDVPACVRPSHLMLGSQLANIIDAVRKGRMTPVPKTHCKRGHAFEGNTYIHPTTHRRSCHECIRLRNAGRPTHLPKGLHWPVPDDRGRCSVCNRRVQRGNFGGAGWRHSRFDAHLVWEGAAGMVDEAVG